MSHLLKLLTLFVFITAVTGCALNDKIPQSTAAPAQPNKNHNIHVSFNFDTGTDQGNHISGFRLYQEGKLVCETDNPQSKNIECNISSPSGSFVFTLTAYYDDGSESPHSKPFSYKIPD